MILQIYKILFLIQILCIFPLQQASASIYVTKHHSIDTLLPKGITINELPKKSNGEISEKEKENGYCHNIMIFQNHNSAVARCVSKNGHEYISGIKIVTRANCNKINNFSKKKDCFKFIDADIMDCDGHLVQTYKSCEEHALHHGSYINDCIPIPHTKGTCNTLQARCGKRTFYLKNGYNCKFGNISLCTTYKNRKQLVCGNCTNEQSKRMRLREKI